MKNVENQIECKIYVYVCWLGRLTIIHTLYVYDTGRFRVTFFVSTSVFSCLVSSLCFVIHVIVIWLFLLEAFANMYSTLTTSLMLKQNEQQITWTDKRIGRRKSKKKRKRRRKHERERSAKHNRRITIEICMRFTENHIHNQFQRTMYACVFVCVCVLGPTRSTRFI